jgi:hypothetical protein
VASALVMTMRDPLPTCLAPPRCKLVAVCVAGCRIRAIAAPVERA